MEKITWEELTEIEPALLDLESDLAGVKDNDLTKPFCAVEFWYGRLHFGDMDYDRAVRRLVGFGTKSNNPKIVNDQALELAYSYLGSLLPPCRGCGCKNEQK